MEANGARSLGLDCCHETRESSQKPTRETATGEASRAVVGVRLGQSPSVLGMPTRPKARATRRKLRTLIRQSTSKVEEALCVLPQSVLFGVYRRRRSSH